ncbi:SRPBCC domain-containing protein [Fulvivirga ligni]|uniref:SRPBCC domain-containing protein n=1 Tax=Fulvivirga ligni TaxID=2904246 RepID=UPI001F293512|nr:SRPBCC domain-containing protein [Fulvivirga ligni]UII23995.1 SRPBCC domain-containing protein [Fulvivirga ligni]
MESLTVRVLIESTPELVWELWTGPEHIIQWCRPSDTVSVTQIKNDLKPNGKFSYTMGTNEGITIIEHSGYYGELEAPTLMTYKLDDGRTVTITFISDGNLTRITEVFELRANESAESQRAGWQRILNNFKNYVEEYIKEKSFK